MSGEGREPAGDLAAELTRMGFLELFLRLDEEALDAVWARPDAPAELRRLALDRATPPLPAFLAAEVLTARAGDFPAAEDRPTLAPRYAAALREGLTGPANPWGLPGDHDGQVAVHVLALGAVAAPALAGLLDDETPVRYGGSAEATYGNSFDYRVKDVAAELVAALLDLPYEVEKDPGARDAAIDLLRQRLG